MRTGDTTADERRAAWALFASLLLLACVGVVYPFIADRTAHPLTVFAMPVLVVVALGTPRATALVGALSVLVTLIEGEVISDYDATPLIARIAVVTATAVSGVVVAQIRRENERELREADHTGELMSTFQRVLVPRPLPPPGIIVDVRYVPGEERLMLGGDFVDALDLPDGSLGFIVGDVCGHGPDAAALGAALRAGWKTIATHAVDAPDTWVRALDEAFFGHGRHDTYATVCTGRVTTAGLVQIVSCGHPWPIVLGAEPTVVRPHVARPLGVRDIPFDPAVTEFAMPVAGAVFIYTDGLIENRLLRELADEDNLLAYLGRHPSPDLDALVTEFGPDGFSDDVAVMTISIDQVVDEVPLHEGQDEPMAATDAAGQTVGRTTGSSPS
ncbi:MAG: PP2C family protein-serine/threonine phosphatase [Acidimicrobiia bacterium]